MLLFSSTTAVLIRTTLSICLLCQISIAQRSFGSVRLAGGSEPTQGRVEILQDGSWNSVCADSWTMNEAHVVCRQLAMPAATEATKGLRFGRGNIEMSVYNYVCTGNGYERTIIECSVERYWDCSNRSSIAGVVCGQWANAQQFDVRLSSGSTRSQGIVEVFYNGVWGTVCDSRTRSDSPNEHREEFWDTNDANVVCRQLGFRAAKRIAAYPKPVDSLLPVILTNQRCKGNETSLGECNVNIMRRGRPYSCSRYQDVSVTCDDTNIRLVDGEEPTQGRVEIYNGISWQTVCSYEWGLAHAQVICRQLGMPRATGFTHGERFGPGSGGISMYNYDCTGNEASMFQCSMTVRELRCGHVSDAGVICGVWTHARQFDVRLTGTLSSYQGKVEVFYNGSWGTVCTHDNMLSSPNYDHSIGTHWGTNHAQVVCRQLGYLTASYDLLDGLPDTSLPSVLALARCRGAEANLGACGMRYSGNIGRCSPGHEASVVCDTRLKKDKYDVRLIQAPYPNQGYVQVLYTGTWWSVCSLDWNLTDAQVICKQRGFTDAAYAISNSTGHAAWGALVGSDVLITRVDCVGSEANLADCPTSFQSRDSCLDHGPAGVVCQSQLYPSHFPGDIDNRTARIIALAITIPLLILILINLALHVALRRCRHHESQKQREIPFDFSSYDFSLYTVDDNSAKKRKREQRQNLGMSKRAWRRAQRKTRREEYVRKKAIKRMSYLKVDPRTRPPVNKKGRPPSCDELHRDSGSTHENDTVNLLPMFFHNGKSPELRTVSRMEI